LIGALDLGLQVIASLSRLRRTRYTGLRQTF